MVRPRKQIHRTRIQISCYQEDIDFIDDHRGDLTTSRYLLEAAYQHAGETTRIEKVIIENQKLKRTIQELKKQMMFEQSRRKDRLEKGSIIENKVFVDWYNRLNMTEIMNKMGISRERGVNFNALLDAHCSTLSELFDSPEKLRKACIEYKNKNNGHKIEVYE